MAKNTEFGRTAHRARPWQINAAIVVMISIAIGIASCYRGVNDVMVLSGRVAQKDLFVALAPGTDYMTYRAATMVMVFGPAVLVFCAAFRTVTGKLAIRAILALVAGGITVSTLSVFSLPLLAPCVASLSVTAVSLTLILARLRKSRPDIRYS